MSKRHVKRNKPRSRDEKKLAKLQQIVATQKKLESLSLVIGRQALPLDAGPEVLERDPADFYPASTRFDQLPLSDETHKGLLEAGFETLTAIQRASIPHALVGRNVVGTAKTGSGKTLAFLVPLVERLYREQWTSDNGLGAIVVSPTRELAMQTFDQLKLVCKHHKFEGGLLIGKGMDLSQERADVARYSIIVATPGRLLQHLDESSVLQTHELQMIVFDECDRLLDLGFEKAVDAILGHLPPVVSGESHELQCLMFSATNNRALVSQRIQNVPFVDVDPHRFSKSATPNALKHFAMNVTLDQKIAVAWSFIKQHLFAKMMIFVASCKQARYLEEVFRRLAVAPGWIGAIHGRVLQTKRMAKYYEFRKLKSGILICTDVAARGLDFPAVDWVIQMDMPEDTESYIHRVGRTARLGGEGSALLFLMPSERAFLNKLAQKGIVLETVEPNAKFLKDPSGSIQALISSDAELKYAAQKAFVCYMRSVYLAKDKEVFDITNLPYRGFSQSLGLITVPKIKFGKSKRVNKNTPYAMRSQEQVNRDSGGNDSSGEEDDSSSSSSSSSGESEHEEPVRQKKRAPVSRIDKLLKRGTQHRVSLREMEPNDDAGDDLFVLERQDHELDNDDDANDDPDEPGVRKKRFQVDPEAYDVNWGAKAEEYSSRLKEKVQANDTSDRLTAKQRRREKRMLAKKERKEEARRRKMAKQTQMGMEVDEDQDDHEEDRFHGANDDSDSNSDSSVDTRPIVSQMSLAEREALAMKMIQDDF